MSDSACIPHDHPAIPGHFPGHPIVPGALIVAEVIAAFSRRWPELTVAGLRRAKFVRPVRPEQTLLIEFSAPGATGIRFIVRVDRDKICEGQLALG